MYCPKVNPLNEKLKKKIRNTDFEKFKPMLIGWDIYVDVEGNPGFYEGNSCPFALGDYESMFGDSLSKSLAQSLKKKGIIGINVDFSTADGAVAYNGKVAQRICERYGLEYIMGDSENLKWNQRTKKFYFEEEGERKRFDFLFNRYPPFCRKSAKLIPKTYWKQAPILSPIPIMKILANKMTTSMALGRLGIETPFALRVENASEYREAAEKIMAHIKNNHPNYQAPFILSKPVAGTGANGVKIFRDVKSINFDKIKFPCMVCERVSVSPAMESDGAHMIDARMFYAGNGHVSHAIGRVAPLPIRDKGIQKESYVTNLCKGGHATSFNLEIEKMLQEYVLAATIAVNKYQDYIIKR